LRNGLSNVFTIGFYVNAVGEVSARLKFVATLAAVGLAIVLGVLDYLTGREWAISAF